jgi:hypothetical protein
MTVGLSGHELAFRADGSSGKVVAPDVMPLAAQEQLSLVKVGTETTLNKTI